MNTYVHICVYIYMARFGMSGLRMRRLKVSSDLDGNKMSTIVKMPTLLLGFESKFSGSLFF